MINETKKPMYKKWWFWLIAVVVFFGMIDMIIPDDEPQSNNEETVTQKIEQPTPVEELPKVETVDYTVFSEEDISYAGCKRVAIKIQVADDAEQVAVDATLETIVTENKSQWDDITVWAYSNDVDPSTSMANMGTEEYSICN